jgi:hypothetical protein
MRFAALLLIPVLALASGCSSEPATGGALGMRIEAIRLERASGGATEIATQDRVTAVLFTSTICPVSNSYNERMKALYNEYSPRGVQFVFVNANASETGADIERHARAQGFPFPVYRDVGNGFADRVGARVTPHAFVFDKRGALVYRGAIDNGRSPSNITKQPLRAALDAVLAGKPIREPEVRAFGCSIERVKQEP